MRRKDKLEIQIAARDAVFQEISEHHEEQITEYATEQALSEIEQRFRDNAEDEGWWGRAQCVTYDEITHCFQRLYAGILVPKKSRKKRRKRV